MNTETILLAQSFVVVFIYATWSWITFIVRWPSFRQGGPIFRKPRWFEKEMNPNPKHKDLGEDREWELHWGRLRSHSTVDRRYQVK